MMAPQQIQQLLSPSQLQALIHQKQQAILLQQVHAQLTLMQRVCRVKFDKYDAHKRSNVCKLSNLTVMLSYSLSRQTGKLR